MSVICVMTGSVLRSFLNYPPGDEMPSYYYDVGGDDSEFDTSTVSFSAGPLDGFLWWQLRDNASAVVGESDECWACRKQFYDVVTLNNTTAAAAAAYNDCSLFCTTATTTADDVDSTNAV